GEALEAHRGEPRLVLDALQLALGPLALAARERPEPLGAEPRQRRERRRQARRLGGEGVDQEGRQPLREEAAEPRPALEAQAARGEELDAGPELALQRRGVRRARAPAAEERLPVGR